MSMWATVSELFAETFHAIFVYSFRTQNQRKHLEFIFSIKAFPFHSRASIRFISLIHTFYSDRSKYAFVPKR